MKAILRVKYDCRHGDKDLVFCFDNVDVLFHDSDTHQAIKALNFIRLVIKKENLELGDDYTRLLGIRQLNFFYHEVKYMMKDNVILYLINLEEGTIDELVKSEVC